MAQSRTHAFVGGLVASAALGAAVLAPCAARAAGHPVRVYKTADGWPHFFEVWNASRGQYEHKLLMGYGGAWVGENLSTQTGKFDTMAADKVNFLRLWMRPSDGFRAYAYDATERKVDVDAWNGEFFARLDTILGNAEARGIVVEIMLWDRCSGWVGGGVPPAVSWDGWEADGINVLHPDNHYRSSAGRTPIPGLATYDEDRIHNEEWYNHTPAGVWKGDDTVWLQYQKAYMQRLMQEVAKHDNVTLELINEAPERDYLPGGGDRDLRSIALRWRQHMQTWLAANYPTYLTQCNGLDGLKTGNQDDQMRQWAAANPGKVDLIGTHVTWTYDEVQSRYHAYKGVLAACNEDVTDYSDLNKCRRVMWGLIFGGGACSLEDIGRANGAVATRELHAFFYPSADAPLFWEMRPAKGLVAGNTGSRYVLAKDDRSEVLVFVDNTAGGGVFHVNGSGTYRFRWFAANGAGSSWQAWQNGSSWDFAPPNVNYGLQIQTTAPNSVSVVASDADAGEPGNAATLRLTRTGNLEQALVVNFTVGGEAEAGRDYVALGSSVTFPSGAATVERTVQVLDDNEWEGAEALTLTLTAGAGYEVAAPATATLTIADDDAPPMAPLLLRIRGTAQSRIIGVTPEGQLAWRNYGLGGTNCVEYSTGLRNNWICFATLPATAAIQTIQIY